MSQITDEFYKSLDKAGHLVTDCNCGTTHFATGQKASDYEEGELDELKEQAEKNYEGYIEHETDDFVESAHFWGLEYVVDCPCGYLRRVEQFIWANRQIIAQYLKRRTAKEKQEKDSEFEIMNEL